MVERWLPVPGWEGLYSVSDLGRVRSENRIIVDSTGVARTKQGQPLRPGTSGPTGRLLVVLSGNGKRRNALVHQLVLAAFVGPRPEGAEVLHWDDNPRNNELNNLRYGTRSENLRDLVRNGRHHRRQMTHCVNGHEFSEPNTGWHNGCRYCRACIRVRSRARRRRESAT
jgi:hypothetical protein